MKLQDKWKQFEQTGRVEDYLAYRERDVSQENSLQTEHPFLSMYNRTGEQYGSRAGRSDRNGADGIAGEGVR